MDTTKTIAALFDFDGVIMDTETQYTVFWDEQGRKYLNEEDFGRRIKGQTLTQIFLGPPRSSTRDYGRTQYL